MLDVEYKELLGARAGKRIAFTGYATFSELFSEWKPFGEGVERYPNQHGVSDYCSTFQTDLDSSLCVKAQPVLVEWIRTNMILADNDAWSFDLVQRKDGILVVVKNEQIIASRWLALLDTDPTMSEINRLISV